MAYSRLNIMIKAQGGTLNAGYIIAHHWFWHFTIPSWRQWNTEQRPDLPTISLSRHIFFAPLNWRQIEGGYMAPLLTVQLPKYFALFFIAGHWEQQLSTICSTLRGYKLTVEEILGRDAGRSLRITPTPSYSLGQAQFPRIWIMVRLPWVQRLCITRPV